MKRRQSEIENIVSDLVIECEYFFEKSEKCDFNYCDLHPFCKSQYRLLKMLDKQFSRIEAKRKGG